MKGLKWRSLPQMLDYLMKNQFSLPQQNRLVKVSDLLERNRNTAIDTIEDYRNNYISFQQYEYRIELLGETKKKMLELSSKKMKELLTDKTIICFGYGSISEPERMIIPEQHWPFLNFDFENNRAIGNGLFWGSLKLIYCTKLSENQKSET
ncbi:MAG: hypothetical protein HQL86_00120 [Magnetococcales bacterium]|nr:hypothetical protein [Magnetococcales bacterium]